MPGTRRYSALHTRPAEAPPTGGWSSQVRQQGRRSYSLGSSAPNDQDTGRQRGRVQRGRLPPKCPSRCQTGHVSVYPLSRKAPRPTIRRARRLLKKEAHWQRPARTVQKTPGESWRPSAASPRERERPRPQPAQAHRPHMCQESTRRPLLAGAANSRPRTGTFTGVSHLRQGPASPPRSLSEQMARAGLKVARETRTPLPQGGSGLVGPSGVVAGRPPTAGVRDGSRARI